MSDDGTRSRRCRSRSPPAAPRLHAARRRHRADVVRRRGTQPGQRRETEGANAPCRASGSSVRRRGLPTVTVVILILLPARRARRPVPRRACPPQIARAGSGPRENPRPRAALVKCHVRRDALDLDGSARCAAHARDRLGMIAAVRHDLGDQRGRDTAAPRRFRLQRRVTRFPDTRQAQRARRARRQTRREQVLPRWYGIRRITRSGPRALSPHLRDSSRPAAGTDALLDDVDASQHLP